MQGHEVEKEYRTGPGRLSRRVSVSTCTPDPVRPVDPEILKGV